METSNDPGRDDKLAQNIYTMVESFLNSKFRSDISEDISESRRNSIEINTNIKKHGRGKRRHKKKHRSENIEEEETIKEEITPQKHNTKTTRGSYSSNSSPERVIVGFKETSNRTKGSTTNSDSDEGRGGNGSINIVKGSTKKTINHQSNDIIKSNPQIARESEEDESMSR